MEQISPHISVNWLHQRSLMLVIPTSPARVDFEAYTTWLTQLLATWQRDKPFLICYDLSTVQITPMGIHLATTVGKMMPMDLIGRTAIVLPQRALMNVFIQMFNRNIPLSNPSMKRQYFMQRDEGLKWLEEGLTK